MTIHQPVVAGMFYPADPGTLGAEVDRLLAAAPPLDVAPPKAVILPHAGYRYSGAVAASAVIALGAGVRRAVVLGPSHYVSFQGVALPAADRVATPLGEIPVDMGAVAALLREPDVAVHPGAHAREHSVEVELPFLQRRLGDFSVVPLVVGEIRPERLAEILETLWGGDETLIVISTDLTHFLTAREAERVDARTAAAVETCAPDGLTGFEACGHRPLASFLTCAGRRGMRLTRTALTHSGRVTGDSSRVVGYGAWIAHEAEAARLSPDHRAAALGLARAGLDGRVRHGRSPDLDLAALPLPLQGVAPAFVTLTLAGELRGCIGSLEPRQALARDILANTVRAGIEDPRFPPLRTDELAGTRIEIAVVGRPAEIRFADEDDLGRQLRPGRDGLILEAAGLRGTFLPKVWDQLRTAEAFLEALKQKAGLPPGGAAGNMRAWRYVTESFAEPAGAI